MLCGTLECAAASALPNTVVRQAIAYHAQMITQGVGTITQHPQTTR